MASVCVAQGATLRVEDGIEAGNEHVGRYVGKECLVDPPKHLARRGGGTLGREPQHAAGGGHNQCCRHPLACCVPHHKPQSTFREEVEVVEVSSYLPSWLVVWRDLPTLQSGHLLGQRSLLDAPRHPKLLLDALALDPLLLQTLSPQF